MQRAGVLVDAPCWWEMSEENVAMTRLELTGVYSNSENISEWTTCQSLEEFHDGAADRSAEMMCHDWELRVRHLTLRHMSLFQKSGNSLRPGGKGRTHDSELILRHSLNSLSFTSNKPNRDHSTKLQRTSGHSLEELYMWEGAMWELLPPGVKSERANVRKQKELLCRPPRERVGVLMTFITCNRGRS